MKTQNFGAEGATRHRSYFYLIKLCRPMSVRAVLENYRENRENDSEAIAKNSALPVFPSAGFETLNITDCNPQSGKCPDKEGRYWYNLSLRDEGLSGLFNLILGNERIESGFYYEEDKGRGFPTQDVKGNNVWWFIIGHADGTRITGFCQEPDYSEGFPREDGWEYYNFKFYDAECPSIRQWMEAKDALYLNDLKANNPALYRQEIADLKVKNPAHPFLQQLAVEEAQEEQRMPAEKTKRETEEQQEPNQDEQLKRETQENEASQKIKRLEEEVAHLQIPEKTAQALHYNDLEFVRELAAGSFGKVWQGKWLGTPVAIKEPHGNNDANLMGQDELRRLNETYQKSLRDEAAMMATLHHPNIVKLYGMVTAPRFCVVMELMTHSLYALLNSNQPLDWSLRYLIGLDIAQGLRYLHRVNVLHRDLKSHNVLIDNQHRAKLSDYGTSKYGTAYTTQSLYSPFWLAPELLILIFNPNATVNYTQACDVYSFAVVLWEVASRKAPRYITPPELMAGLRQEIPRDTPPNIALLITYCWDNDAGARFDMNRVVQEMESNPIVDNRTASPLSLSTPSNSSTSSSSSDIHRSSSGSVNGSVFSSRHSVFASAPRSVGSGSSSSLELMTPVSANSGRNQTPPLLDEDVLEAVAIRNYRAKRAGELTVIRGARIMVLEIENDDWWRCEYRGKQGLVPSGCLELAEPVVDIDISPS